MNQNYEITPSTKKSKGKAGWIIATLALVFLVAGGWVVYRYAVMGWLTTDVTVEVELYDDGSALVAGELNGFAGIKDVSYTVDEEILIIELRCTWPVFGRSREFVIMFEDDSFRDVLEVDVSDGRNQLVVWSKE